NSAAAVPQNARVRPSLSQTKEASSRNRGVMTRPLSDKQQKKLADDARLLKVWKKSHRGEREAVLAGPHGTVLSELFRMFENLQNVQPSQLIGFVGSIDWASIDYAIRLTVLHEVNNAITSYREKRGLEPIDDNLTDQVETPFRTIKVILFPSNDGAHRGEARRGHQSSAA